MEGKDERTKKLLDLDFRCLSSMTRIFFFYMIKKYMHGEARGIDGCNGKDEWHVRREMAGFGKEEEEKPLLRDQQLR
jgi:hypothetical protein